MTSMKEAPTEVPAGSPTRSRSELAWWQLAHLAAIRKTEMSSRSDEEPDVDIELSVYTNAAG